MVCPLGSGRMKALARLLVAGNIQQAASDEAGRLKFAAQYIQRELREADEVNLIDEEDMHVFGLRPLTDPLHLGCAWTAICFKAEIGSQVAVPLLITLSFDFCLNVSEEKLLEKPHPSASTLINYPSYVE